MSIIGIGTDIVEISRIEKLVEKYPKGFAERVLHENECIKMQGTKNPITFVAKRFAAKEALAKALGTGIAKGVSFQEIEVTNNESGQPQLILHSNTLKVANNLGVSNSFISLSDERKYAIAYVVLEN